MPRRPYWPRLRLAAERAATWALLGGVLVALHALEPRWRDAVQLGYVIAFLLGVVLLPEALGASRRRAAHAIQVHRDREASELHRAIARRDEREPYPERLRGTYDLYLRPFESTAHVKVVVRSWVQRRRSADPGLVARVEITGWGRSSTHRRYVVWGDLETLIAEQLERSGRRLVALG